jgi:hypothetical protein
MSMEAVEKLLDETNEAREYQKVSVKLAYFLMY